MYREIQYFMQLYTFNSCFTGLQFVRVENFVFSHVADEGLINACAGSLLRYSRNIGAKDIIYLTDIKKKHW